MQELNLPKPSLSVVIPAYNEEKTIRSCILSIQKQDIHIPYEIIVINNASTDNTAEEATRTGVKVINEPTKGLYYARQRGLNLVHSDYLMYVDADTTLPRDWMRKTITFLETHPDFVAASGNYYFRDASIYFKPLHIFSQFIAVPLLLYLFRILQKPDFLIGTGFIVKTKVLKELGGFSKDFPFYGEDVALAKRLATKGKIKFFPRLFLSSSARRYNNLGILKTHLSYYRVALSIIFGDLKKAAKLSQKYTEKDSSSQTNSDL